MLVFLVVNYGWLLQLQTSKSPDEPSPNGLFHVVWRLVDVTELLWAQICSL